MAATPTPETIGATRHAYGVTAAWGALTLTYPRHAAEIADAANGTRTSVDMPARLAVDIVALCDTIDAVDRFVYGDTRSSVTTAAQLRLGALDLADEPTHDEHIAALRTADISEHPEIADLLNYADTDTRAALYLEAYGPALPARTAVVACVRMLAEDRSYTTPLPADDSGDPEARGRIVAAAAIHGYDLDDAPSLTATDLRIASGHVHDLAGGGGYITGRHGRTNAVDATERAMHVLATAIITHPDTTDDDLCGHWGIDTLADATADHVAGIARQWDSTAPVAPDGEPVLLDDLLDAVTHHGTRHLPAPDLVHHTSSSLPYRTAVAITPHDDVAEDLYISLVTDGGAQDDGPRWTADEIDAITPHGHPVRHQLIEAVAQDASDHTTTPHTPTNLLDDAFNARGLHSWLGATPDPIVAARLTAAADNAGFGIDDWALLWRHLSAFHGTPEQLVDMLTEVLPDTAAA